MDVAIRRALFKIERHCLKQKGILTNRRNIHPKLVNRKWGEHRSTLRTSVLVEYIVWVELAHITHIDIAINDTSRITLITKVFTLPSVSPHPK